QEDLATPPFVISRLTGRQMEFPKGFTEIHLAWAVRVRGIKIVDAQIERLQNDLDRIDVCWRPLQRRLSTQAERGRLKMHPAHVAPQGLNDGGLAEPPVGAQSQAR